MTDKNKKILAREFLFLLGSIVFFLIAIAIWTWRYEANSKKYWDSKKEFDELIKAEDLSYRVKVYHYVYQDFPELRDKINNATDFVRAISKNETSEFIYDRIHEKGLITREINHFRTKIKNDIEFKDQAKKYNRLKNNIDNRYHSIFSSMRDHEIWELGVLILTLTFGLRYLIYSTNWSIKQLKE